MGISNMCCSSIETPMFLETFKMKITGRVENNVFTECCIKLVHNLLTCRKQLWFLEFYFIFYYFIFLFFIIYIYTVEAAYYDHFGTRAF